MRTTEEILQCALKAKRAILTWKTEEKNTALHAMADALIASTDEILQANTLDVADSTEKLGQVMTDRLRLTEDRIASMAKGIRDVAALEDPAGKILETIYRPNGLCIQKMSVPMGVIAIIYESRPNVTSDAAALCLKSGSVCVLRCGKEANRSAKAIVSAMQKGINAAGFSGDVIQLIEDTSRASATALMHADGYIDLLIPRGGKGLIQACIQNATVPCIQTGTGICHVYVDAAADLEKALTIIENAKTSRPSVCNAEEVCLVHKDIADAFLPKLHKKLVDDRIAAGTHPVELRLDPQAAAVIQGIPASTEDFDTEFLDYILAVRVVSSVEEAIEHISQHSTGHSDAIISEDEVACVLFTAMVDSAAVYVNASTRFTDGGEFGLGCEMGISTQKLHARGPMGLSELCTYKYIIRGNGQIRV